MIRGDALNTTLHTADPKNSPGRTLFGGGRKQNAGTVRAALRKPEERKKGPRKRT